MDRTVFLELFSPDEVARAAGAPRERVTALLAAGDFRPVAGTDWFTGADAVAIAQRLAADAATSTADPIEPAPLFAGRAVTDRRSRIPHTASSLIHATLLVAIMLSAARATDSEEAPLPAEETRMVFVMSPGPGGGGGGGGARQRRPAPKLERAGLVRPRTAVPEVKRDPVLASRRVETPTPTPPPAPVPKPVERAPEPLESRALIAPVASAATSARDRDGVIEDPRGRDDSHGSGSGGGAGTGQGTGNGQGLGSGIGDGMGGGTGGGPYRPGSGIEPPRLLREVKADYTDEGRRRGVTGDVVLEIVIRRDGAVGDVSLVKGLGAGLDQRAIAAVRQWRFSPARRKGEPVDVIVEVAVEFTLR